MQQQSEAEVADAIIDGGLCGTMLEAAVYAIRCGDYEYLRRKYVQHVVPLLVVEGEAA